MDLSPQEPKVIEVTINWNGAPSSHQINTSANVKQLKQMIKNEFHNKFQAKFRIKKQDLEYNGKWLQNELKLEDYGIDSHVNINLVKKIDLWIFKDRDEKSTYLMLVNETTTVAKLKEIIAEHFGESNITRLCANRNDIPFKDHLTLNDYGIPENSEITYYVD